MRVFSWGYPSNSSHLGPVELLPEGVENLGVALLGVLLHVPAPVLSPAAFKCTRRQTVRAPAFKCTNLRPSSVLRSADMEKL